MKTATIRNDALQKYLNETFVQASAHLSALTGKEISISRYFLNFIEGDRFIRENRSSDDAAYFASILKLRDIVHMDVVLLISEAEGVALYNILSGEDPEADMAVNDDVIAGIGEVNNILGSCFINVLADKYSVEGHPTTPINTFDMLGAILEEILLQHEYLDKVVLCADVLLREKQMGQFHVRFMVISPQEQLPDALIDD
ncbi:hypothetical protein JXO52_01475 [bacterium]|nr:hypothetical protein [bacterium]